MNQLTAYCSAKSLNHLLQNQVCCFAIWSARLHKEIWDLGYLHLPRFSEHI